MMLLGYTRVSTSGQSLAAQLEARAGVAPERVYCEKLSGAQADQPALAELIKVLRPGDALVLTKLDRMARSLRDLLRIAAEVEANVFEPADAVPRERLLEAGVEPEALRIIERITLPADGRDYPSYSCRLVSSGDITAIEVKLADNLDTVDLLLAGAGPQCRDLLETRYWPSCAVLLNALGKRLDLFAR